MYYLNFGDMATLSFHATKGYNTPEGRGLVVHDEQTNTTYDYIGEPFPEGYIDAETMFLFQHEDID